MTMRLAASSNRYNPGGQTRGLECVFRGEDKRFAARTSVSRRGQAFRGEDKRFAARTSVSRRGQAFHGGDKRFAAGTAASASKFSGYNRWPCERFDGSCFWL